MELYLLLLQEPNANAEPNPGCCHQNHQDCAAKKCTRRGQVIEESRTSQHRQLHRLGAVSSRTHSVMEYCQGGDLRDVVIDAEDKKVSLKTSSRLYYALTRVPFQTHDRRALHPESLLSTPPCPSLLYCHHSSSLGKIILHRDLKPENGEPLGRIP